MKKIYNSLRIVTLAILGLCTACTNDFGESRVEDQFTGFDKALTMQSILADEFEASDFTFTAAQDWICESAQDWITVNPSNGKAGERTIKISTAGNYTKESRRGTLYIKSGQYKIAVIIDQAETGADGSIPLNPDYKFKVIEGGSDMSIFANELTFPALKIYTPDKWTRELTFDEGQSEWLSIEGAPSGNEGQYSFEVKPFAINFTGVEKRAKLTFKLTDEAADADLVEDLVINIVQTTKDENGNDVQLKFNFESGSDADRTIDANQSEFKSFTFTAESVWKAELTGMDWCEVTPLEGVAGEYTITFDAKALNTTEAAKSGAIELSYVDDPAAAPIKVSFDLAQNNTVAGSAFTFDFANSATSGDISFAGGSADVTFDAPFAWTATSSAAWLTLSQSSGDAGTACTITAEAKENGVNAVNVANVTLKSAMPNYDGVYAQVTCEVNQEANPQGAAPIKYSTTIAGFNEADAYAAFQDGKYILEITDGGEVTDTDLYEIEKYLNPESGKPKPTSGTVILSLPYITRIITKFDKVEGSNATDDYVFNAANAVRELWMPSLTVRPHKLWNMAFLEVLYMPKAGGDMVYDIFKMTGKQTAAGGLSVLVIGAEGDSIITYSKGKAFKNCGDLSECKFYTSETNQAKLESALKGSGIKYGPIISDEVYTPENL